MRNDILQYIISVQQKRFATNANLLRQLPGIRKRVLPASFCALHAHRRASFRNHCPASVAATFAKAAERVYSIDWIGFDEPIADAFTTKELGTLARLLPSLQSMVETALGRQDSVWGAKLAGHFRISKVLPLLRYYFLTPRRCYGWEGPDYSKQESYLADNQYQYSVAYLEAIEAITGKPIAEAVALTESEASEIQKHAVNENSESFHWAVWMQRKLNMKMRPNQASEDTARKLADPQR